jgi:hypothetical protein
MSADCGPLEAADLFFDIASDGGDRSVSVDRLHDADVVDRADALGAGQAEEDERANARHAVEAAKPTCTSSGRGVHTHSSCLAPPPGTAARMTGLGLSGLEIEFRLLDAARE